MYEVDVVLLTYDHLYRLVRLEICSWWIDISIWEMKKQEQFTLTAKPAKLNLQRVIIQAPVQIPDASQ